MNVLAEASCGLMKEGSYLHSQGTQLFILFIWPGQSMSGECHCHQPSPSELPDSSKVCF